MINYMKVLNLTVQLASLFELLIILLSSCELISLFEFFIDLKMSFFLFEFS